MRHASTTRAAERRRAEFVKYARSERLSERCAPQQHAADEINDEFSAADDANAAK